MKTALVLQQRPRPRDPVQRIAPGTGGAFRVHRHMPPCVQRDGAGAPAQPGEPGRDALLFPVPARGLARPVRHGATAAALKAKRAAQRANVIAAPRAAGVGVVACTSILPTRDMVLTGEHAETKDAPAASGWPDAILCNG
ncbi:hypothetical protein AL035_06785 [Salipiger aestuarii]|nr:hypothetical protein [Salipiger aestuarii]KAB2542398.1 hypothetical protein AL035_06785 [Salipiger aestuarii]